MRFKPEGIGFIRYGWALGIVCLCIVLRVWLEPVLGKQAGLLFWAAILICPWIGGLVPSLIGQTMIWAAQWHWFTPPTATPWRPSLGELLFIAIYYLFGSTIGVASDLRRKAQRRARTQQAEAISQREQLRATLSCMADGVLVTDDAGSSDAHESGRGSHDRLDDRRIARQAAAGVFRRSSRR